MLIHVTSHDRTHDPGQWRDRKTLLEDGIDAEGESEKTSQRVQRDVRARAASGKPHGPSALRVLARIRLRRRDARVKDATRRANRGDVHDKWLLSGVARQASRVGYGAGIGGIRIWRCRVLHQPVQRAWPAVAAGV